MTALNPDTGAVVWSYQIVHHDIWDYDTNSAPTLFDLKQADGSTVPALVQSSKMGFLFVLNRLTGKPIFPIDEKAVPASDVAGRTGLADAAVADDAGGDHARPIPRRLLARRRSERRLLQPHDGGPSL